MDRPKQTRIDDALLKQFSQGRLDSELESKLAVAIEKSPDLQARVAALSGDVFLQKVKQVAVASRTSRTNPPHASSDLADAPDDDLPQELIASPDYEILKELGRGGMGVVYAAKYLPMDRLEVLKVLNPQLVQKEAARQRFINEMKAIGKLNHPFIATAYQRVVLPNQLVFSMEYVPGRDLHKFIQKYRPVPVPIACTFASQIATALGHAHSRKMVHRDIKPSNVMVYEEDGKRQIKILDFGLAKATSEQQADGITADGTMLGTPEYMAPEQALDAATADIRADIYSLGCTLYHLLVGKPPFTGTYQSVLMAHAQKDAPFINLTRPEVPVELARIVAKMIAKEPSKRFQTPKAVVAAMKPFIGNAKITPTRQVGEAKVDTRNHLASPSRDTSVETPAVPDVAHAVKSDVMASLADLKIENQTTRKRAKPTPLKRSAKSRRRKKRPITTMVVGGLLAVLLLSGIVFNLKTPNGTLVIKNLPDDAQVLVDEENVKLQWNDGKDSATVRIQPGTRRVEVLSGGIKIAGETVAIATDKEVSITVKESPISVSEKIATQPTDPPSDSDSLEAKLDSLLPNPSSLASGDVETQKTTSTEVPLSAPAQVQDPSVLSSSVLVGASRFDLEQWLDQLDDSIPLSVSVRCGQEAPAFDAVAVELKKSSRWRASFYENDKEAGKDFVKLRGSHGVYWRLGIPSPGTAPNDCSGLKFWRASIPSWNTANYGTKRTSSVIQQLRKSGGYANSIAILKSGGLTNTHLLTTKRPQQESSPYGALSLDELRERIEFYRAQDWYLEYFQLHSGTETPTLAAVFCKSTGPRQWSVSIDLNQRDFWEMRSSQKSNGYYPRSLGSYQSGDETFYIVLWHRVSDEPIF